MRTVSTRLRNWLAPVAAQWGTVAVVGAKDRTSNSVAAKVVESTDKSTLQGFVVE